MNLLILRLRHPARAAQLLAEIIGGEALPMPPGSNCWMVLGAEDEGVTLCPDVLNRHSADIAEPADVAELGIRPPITSALTSARVQALARKAGWPVNSLSGQDARVAISIEGREALVLVCAATNADKTRRTRRADDETFMPPHDTR